MLPWVPTPCTFSITIVSSEPWFANKCIASAIFFLDIKFTWPPLISISLSACAKISIPPFTDSIFTAAILAPASLVPSALINSIVSLDAVVELALNLKYVSPLLFCSVIFWVFPAEAPTPTSGTFTLTDPSSFLKTSVFEAWVSKPKWPDTTCWSLAPSFCKPNICKPVFDVSVTNLPECGCLALTSVVTVAWISQSPKSVIFAVLELIALIVKSTRVTADTWQAASKVTVLPPAVNCAFLEFAWL